MILLENYLNMSDLFNFLGIMGTFLNAMVIVATLKENAKLNQFEVCLLNLSLVDLLQSVLAYPLDVMSDLSHRWLFGHIGKRGYNRQIEHV